MGMDRFRSKTAIITGSATGIGAACALRFAGEGANVVCIDNNETANTDTAVRCMAEGVGAVALHLAVEDPAAAGLAVQRALDEFGGFDILVCSAGIYTGSPLPTVSLDQWRRMLDVNLTGTFLFNQAVAAHLMEKRSGSIINIASMAAKTSWPATAEYSAAKSGLLGLTRSVAMELGPYGITANAVCPGNTLTEMVRKVAAEIGALQGLTAEEWLVMRANDAALRRIAEPWEIAGTVAFLASEDARYITGQSIEVDGGIIL